MKNSSWSGCYFLPKFSLSLSLSPSVYLLLMLWHFLFLGPRLLGAGCYRKVTSDTLIMVDVALANYLQRDDSSTNFINRALATSLAVTAYQIFALRAI